MSKLINIIFQGGSFITMLVLELLCFYLIINFNSQQRNIWIETVAVYTGRANEKFTSLGEYVALKETVDGLNDQIATYKTALEGTYLALAAEVDSVRNDSLRQRFVFQTATIVNRSPYGPNNTCIINRGKQDGIEIGQGVVANKGLLGVITAVTQKHARVMTLLHRDAKLTGGLKNNYFGTIRWDGKDPRRVVLNDLKDYIPVATGDTVYTTGYSSIFPTGIAIGTVNTANKLLGTGNWQLEVDLLEDPLKMRHVFVVQDLFKEDIAPLMEQ